jgi:phosphoglycolate phosphatase-like HAD superfamily hydrolase
MPLDVGRIRALCFDVDGTLSDTDDQFVNRLAGYLRPIRFLFRAQDAKRAARRLVMWAEAPGNALIGVPDALGLDDELAAVVEWLNRHRPRPKKDFLLVPGVKDMLGRLRGRYPMSVVSARDEESTRMFLDQFGLTGFFKVIVTALTTEHTKPFPDPIIYAAGAMGVTPENCLMIGDTTVDIRAGRAAGAQTVGVLCGFGEAPELHRMGADEVLPSTADLASVLLND